MVLYILYFLEKVVADIQELKQTLIINTIHLNTPGDMSSLQIAIKSTLLINPNAFQDWVSNVHIAGQKTLKQLQLIPLIVSLQHWEEY